MANVTINPTPKLRFQQSKPFMEAHRDMLASDEFARGVDAAMLQYQTELALNCKDQYSSMAMGLRLLGAQEFVAKLWELGHIPEKFTPKLSDNLDHRV